MFSNAITENTVTHGRGEEGVVKRSAVPETVPPNESVGAQCISFVEESSFRKKKIHFRHFEGFIIWAQFLFRHCSDASGAPSETRGSG